MGIVGTGFSMSLDGFIAGPNVSREQPLGERGMRLFQWYGSGDTEYTMPDGRMVVKVSQASANVLRELHGQIGALVTGRRMFDIMQGWGGNHPSNVAVFVVTHHPPQDWPHEWPREGSPFTFVTDGVESAIRQAQAVAGDKMVALDGASIVQQAIKAGLVDEIGIDLVPFLLGAGVRYFDRLGPEPIELERVSVVETPDVTHLRFRVIK